MKLTKYKLNKSCDHFVKRKKEKRKQSKSFTDDSERAFIQIDARVIEAFRVFSETLNKYLMKMKRKSKKTEKKAIETKIPESKPKETKRPDRKRKKPFKHVRKEKMSKPTFNCSRCERVFESNHGLKIHIGKKHKGKLIIKQELLS